MKRFDLGLLVISWRLMEKIDTSEVGASSSREEIG
jgi:hypothetical protein